MTARPVDVVVAGAGPAGLASAAALARAGASVTVLDRGEPEGAGSALTLWPNALTALEALDALSVLTRATPLPGMQISDLRGRLLAGFDDDEFRTRFGAAGLVMTRADLITALRRILLSVYPDQVTIESRTTLVGFEQVGKFIRCQTNRGPILPSALVGADGAHSTVAAGLHPTRKCHPLNMRVVRGIAPLDIRPHPADMLMGVGVQFGIFAMTGSTYWFASYGEPPTAPRRIRSTLATRLAGFSDLAHDLVTATPDEALVVTETFDCDPAPAPWGKGPVTVVGDAAHFAAPTLGQGACHALEDAAALASSSVRHDGWPDRFRDYEHNRADRASRHVRAARQAARAGVQRSAVLAAARNAALRTMPRAVLARQLAAQFRAGG